MDLRCCIQYSSAKLAVELGIHGRTQRFHPKRCMPAGRAEQQQTNQQCRKTSPNPHGCGTAPRRHGVCHGQFTAAYSRLSVTYAHALKRSTCSSEKKIHELRPRGSGVMQLASPLTRQIRQDQEREEAGSSSRATLPARRCSRHRHLPNLMRRSFPDPRGQVFGCATHKVEGRRKDDTVRRVRLRGHAIVSRILRARI